MDLFELHVCKDEDGGVNVRIDGSRQDAVRCFPPLLNSIANFVGSDRRALAFLALAALDAVPPDSEHTTMQVDLVADALRKMRERQEP